MDDRFSNWNKFFLLLFITFIILFNIFNYQYVKFYLLFSQFSYSVRIIYDKLNLIWYMIQHKYSVIYHLEADVTFFLNNIIARNLALSTRN